MHVCLVTSGEFDVMASAQRICFFLCSILVRVIIQPCLLDFTVDSYAHRLHPRRFCLVFDIVVVWNQHVLLQSVCSVFCRVDQVRHYYWLHYYAHSPATVPVPHDRKILHCSVASTGNSDDYSINNSKKIDYQF